MWNDAKSKYLFAFEAAVFALIGGYEQAQRFSACLRDGLWCNAHMWHGIGLDVDLAAVKFVTDVIERYHPNLVQPEENVKVCS